MTLLNDEKNNDSLSSNNRGLKEDNKEKSRIIPEGKKPREFNENRIPIRERLQPSPGPPDDSSDSREDSQPNRPPKIPPRSNK
jgi:hypothetical protein